MDESTPEPSVPSNPEPQAFRNGFLTGLVLTYGPQLVTGVWMVLSAHFKHGGPPDMDRAMSMLGADLVGAGLGILGVLVGTMLHARGKRGLAFLGGGATALGLTLLLSLPTCLAFAKAAGG